MRFLIRAATIGLVVLAWTARAAADETIDKSLLKPKASIVVDLPSCGSSERSNGKSPVQMRVILPVNYDTLRAFPVIACLDGGAGSIDFSIGRWVDICQQKNFIFLAVDYTQSKMGYMSGPANAIAALRVLMNATKVYQQGLIISGDSSGSYAITLSAGTPEIQAFSTIVIVCGGLRMSPRDVGPRPVLLVGGEMDTDRASDGESRIDVMKNCNERLLKGGCDSTIIIMPGIAHEWPKDCDGQIRQWLYEKFPLFADDTQLAKQIDAAKDPREKLRFQQELAKTWFDLPGVDQAKQAVPAAPTPSPGRAPVATASLGSSPAPNALTPQARARIDEAAKNVARIKARLLAKLYATDSYKTANAAMQTAYRRLQVARANNDMQARLDAGADYNKAHIEVDRLTTEALTDADLKTAEAARRRAEEDAANAQAAPATSLNTQAHARPSIDLLAMIDLTRNTVNGAWQKTSDGIRSGPTPNARVRIPYQPPQEYDLHVEYTRIDGQEGVYEILAAAGKSFHFVAGSWTNTLTGFALINGHTEDSNPTTAKYPAAVENGHRYTVLIKVRKDSIWASIDGTQVAQYKTDLSDLTTPDEWSVGQDCLGVGSHYSSTVFHVIQIVEVSGPGKPLGK